MKGWLVYERNAAEYNRSYIEFHQEEGKKLGITFDVILVEQLQFGVRNQKLYITYENKEISLPDFVICRVIYPLLVKQFEKMGVRVFNDSKISEICNDKAKTYQLLADRNINMIDTEFVRFTDLKEKLQRAVAPIVVKAVAGHGGSQVFCYDGTNLEEILKAMKEQDVVLQPLTGRGQDCRVYVVGNKILTAVLRSAKEGFKSNYSLGGAVEEYALKKEEVKLVKEIISLFQIGLAGIDFIIGDEGEFIFNEIEDVVGARMLYQCTNINLVEAYLQYIKSVL